jgi:hypothetical protein
MCSVYVTGNGVVLRLSDQGCNYSVTVRTITVCPDGTCRITAGLVQPKNLSKPCAAACACGWTGAKLLSNKRPCITDMQTVVYGCFSVGTVTPTSECHFVPPSCCIF